MKLRPAPLSPSHDHQAPGALLRPGAPVELVGGVVAPDGDGARDGAARPPNPAEAIVRNLMRAFPNAVFALVCPELPAAADELGFVVRHQCPLGQSAVWVLVPPSEPVTSQG